MLFLGFWFIIFKTKVTQNNRTGLNYLSERTVCLNSLEFDCLLSFSRKFSLKSFSYKKILHFCTLKSVNKN